VVHVVCGPVRVGIEIAGALVMLAGQITLTGRLTRALLCLRGLLPGAGGLLVRSRLCAFG
jgi:hypothetical protein